MTNINFPNISSQVKTNNTMKYFQTILTKIASTMTEEEKNVRKLTLQFLVRHNYFGLDWKNLSEEKRNNLIEVIADGKGLTSYKDSDD